MGNMIQIDGTKLNDILLERKLKKSHVSTGMGFNDGFINHCILRNQISRAAAQLMEARYGIPLSDYEWAEPEPAEEPEAIQTEIEEPKTETPGVVALDLKEFQQAVELAMGNMKTDYDAMRGAIREGVLDAINAAVQDSDMRYMITGLLSNAVAAGLAKNLQDRIRGLKGGK